MFKDIYKYQPSKLLRTHEIACNCLPPTHTHTHCIQILPAAWMWLFIIFLPYEHMLNGVIVRALYNKHENIIYVWIKRPCRIQFREFSVVWSLSHVNIWIKATVQGIFYTNTRSHDSWTLRNDALMCIWYIQWIHRREWMTSPYKADTGRFTFSSHVWNKSCARPNLLAHVRLFVLEWKSPSYNHVDLTNFSEIVYKFANQKLIV